MQTKKLGNSGIECSVVGLGTWAIGGGDWWGESDESESIKTIHTALDCGVNLIDTAPAYGFGYSEEVVGKAIHDRRDKVVLSTKCGMWWGESPAGQEGTFAFEQKGIKVYKNLKPFVIRQEVEQSLKRLKTDYIDIYHTHWQDVLTPIEETARCLADLQREGKIRSIAVSNATISDCDEYLLQCSLAANQVKYSMLDRAIEDELIGYSVDKNIGILAYSPLEQGILTGKIGMDKTFTETEYRNFIPWYQPEKRRLVLEMLAAFKPLTEKYDCSLTQLVIAWTAAQRGITSVLCGARKPENIVENAKGGSIVMDNADLAFMRDKVTAIS